MLQFVYDSAWHLPAISFLSITVLFLVMARRLPFIVGFSLVFGWLIAADAWGNGAVSAVPANLRGYYGLLFVLLGDWRYFILVERYSLGELTPLRWLRSAALPFLMPAVFLFFMGRINERVNFFIYEVGFLVIAGVILWVVLPRRRSTDSEWRAFIKSVTQFEIAQYALWAVADLLLLFGHPWAMILRIMANIFYYALFVPFVWWRSPDSPGRRKHFVPATALAAASLAISFVALRASVKVPAAEPVAESPAALNFVDVGKSVRSLQLPGMLESLPADEVSGFDPYYQHQKRWKAISIENVLRKGFGSDPAKMANQDFVIKAIDGFTAFLPGKRLLEGGAYVAFQDLDPSGWEPIGPQKVSPGPFYLVWSRPDQQDLETHPRPWQMGSIETVVFDTRFPHVRPEGAALNSPPARGFEIFRIQCLPCHSLNRAGGQIGPDLNVPRNILEYRDETVIRAFIKNPLSFRYTVMPAHPDMTSSQLDDLIGYLKLMKTQKYDKQGRL